MLAKYKRHQKNDYLGTINGGRSHNYVFMGDIGHRLVSVGCGRGLGGRGSCLRRRAVQGAEEPRGVSGGDGLGGAGQGRQSLGQQQSPRAATAHALRRGRRVRIFVRLKPPFHRSQGAWPQSYRTQASPKVKKMKKLNQMTKKVSEDKKYILKVDSVVVSFFNSLF